MTAPPSNALSPSATASSARASLTPSPTAKAMIRAASRLRRELEPLQFSPPVSHVYNPLEYAWPVHRAYLAKYATSPKPFLFLGMNPGPFGMMQTGVPFGQIHAVRHWMRLHAPVASPPRQHPRRPILGFNCPRSEISGERLWGLFASRHPNPETFFHKHFVTNYCPLSFLEESGRNRTPDKLPATELAAIADICDRHLRQVIKILQPEVIIGVGGFAYKKALDLFAGESIEIVQILHPSPASPAANRDWAGQTTARLIELGLWG